MFVHVVLLEVKVAVLALASLAMANIGANPFSRHRLKSLDKRRD